MKLEKLDLIKYVIKSTKMHLSPKEIYLNIKDGIHSEIPYCCVAWFTFIHAPYYALLVRYFPYLFDNNDPRKRIDIKAEYVQCIYCLLREHKKEIHYCDIIYNKQCAAIEREFRNHILSGSNLDKRKAHYKEEDKMFADSMKSLYERLPELYSE